MYVIPILGNLLFIQFGSCAKTLKFRMTDIRVTQIVLPCSFHGPPRFGKPAYAFLVPNKYKITPGPDFTLSISQL